MANGVGKWLAIGCAGFIVLGLLGSVITGAFVLTALRNSEAFTGAEGWVRAHPEVIARVGEPVETGWFPQGSVSPEEAEFTHRAHGPRGEATIHTTLAYEEGHWVITRASIDEGGRPKALSTDGGAVTGTTTASTTSDVEIPVLVETAARAYAENRDADAIEAADRALERDPAHAQAHYWRGRAEARQGDHERALADFEAAVATTPDYADAWEGLAYARTRAGHDPEAVQALDKLIALRPDDGKAWADRANARYRTGDRAGARTDAAGSCQRGYQAGCDLEARLIKMGG